MSKVNKKFKVGDKVKVVAVVSKYQGWVDEYNVQSMENYYHQVGVVSELDSELKNGYKGCYVKFQDGNVWSFPNPALKKVKVVEIPCEV